MWWPGRGNKGVHGYRKRHKLKCGTEGETVVAHGRLPSSSSVRLTNVVLDTCARISNTRFTVVETRCTFECILYKHDQLIGLDDRQLSVFQGYICTLYVHLCDKQLIFPIEKKLYKSNNFKFQNKFLVFLSTLATLSCSFVIYSVNSFSD